MEPAAGGISKAIGVSAVDSGISWLSIAQDALQGSWFNICPVITIFFVASKLRSEALRVRIDTTGLDAATKVSVVCAILIRWSLVTCKDTIATMFNAADGAM